MSATHHRIKGARYFHGCYSVGNNRLWGVNRRRKRAVKVGGTAARRAAAAHMEDVFAYAEGATLRIDGMETQVRFLPRLGALEGDTAAGEQAA
nr:transposase [Streptomyces sp.]